ncbi:MAG: glycerophosphodiester phosphodiesterase family protein, partial [Planctomycetia bacterium]|nr:glycerophosphodiester phosphodiesterase family protein [Planctomycetia bacterium]
MKKTCLLTNSRVICVVIGLFMTMAIVAVTDVSGKEPVDKSKYFAPEDYPPIPDFFVIAHQGWSGKYPANTLLSYAGTSEAGADACEVDIHRTADGQFVMMHDGDTFRTTGHKGLIREMTFAELRKLDAGIKKGKQFKGTLIPTFDETMALLSKNKCPTLVEIKSSRPFPFDETAKAVIDKIKEYGYLNKVIMNSFSIKHVQRIRAIEPNICVAWNYGGMKNPASVEEMVDDVTKKLKEANTNIILLRVNNLSAESMALFHQRGIHILAW